MFLLEVSVDAMLQTLRTQLMFRPSHSEILCVRRGFQVCSKGVTTPRVKEEDDEDAFKANDVTRFRYLTMKSLLQDMGKTVAINIGVDASAGKAMASRGGLGRATHVRVQYLWVQSLVQGRQRRFWPSFQVKKTEATR